MKPENSEAYEGKRVLVTGATGFIGRHLTSALLWSGAEVFAVARSRFDEDRSQGSLHVDLVDVADAEQLKRCVAKARPDVIFNLAAGSRGGDAADELKRHAFVTIGGAVNLAAAVGTVGSAASRSNHAAGGLAGDVAGNLPLIVQVGSSEEYGDGPAPFSEDQPDKPISLYSIAKAATTRFLLEPGLKLPVIVARPTVAFGPGQDNDMFVPFAISHYLRGAVPDLSAGEQSRDFLYVEDLVAGLLALGLSRHLTGQIFNLGSGRAVSLKQVAGDIARLCNYTGDLGLGRRPYRKKEVMTHIADIEKISERTGWSPAVSLIDGLERTVEWWAHRVEPAPYFQS